MKWKLQVIEDSIYELKLANSEFDTAVGVLDVVFSYLEEWDFSSTGTPNTETSIGTMKNYWV